jgi:signal transduction histidine kinase
MGSTRRVLLVGIEPDDRAAITERLSQLETTVSVLSAADAEAALSSLEAPPEPIDCLVSAHRLAGMDGIAFSRERTRRLASPTVPFVLFVTDGSEALAASALEAGVSGYVRREGPHATDRLVERIRPEIEPQRPEKTAPGAVFDNCRRELRWERERIEDVRHALSHDLRSPLNVATGYLQYVSGDFDTSGGPDEETVGKVSSALGRIDSFLDDVNALIQQGRPVDSADTVELAAVARSGWTDIDTGSAHLRVLDDTRPALGSAVADRERLLGLFRELYRNAIEHGDSDVTVEVGGLPDGFYVEDDGPGIEKNKLEDVFRIGVSDHRDRTGFGLARVRHVAAAHYWDVSIGESPLEGTRIEITGTESVE